MTETTIIHLTDPHIESSAPYRLADDTAIRNLRETVAFLHGRGFAGDPIIISGDLVVSKDREGYARLRAVVDEMRGWGSPVLLGLGNNDDRAAFRAVMLDDETTDPAQPYYYAEWFGGARIIMLDSSIPGKHEGKLDAQQLAWLRGELATSAPEGTVIAIHHPPTLLPQPSAHYLWNTDALREVIAGMDVRAILSGHTHTPIMTAVAGIPCIAAAGTAFLADTRDDGIYLLRHADINVVTVRDGTVEIRPITVPGMGEQLRFLTHEQMQAVMAH